jgi:hypothetical protein
VIATVVRGPGCSSGTPAAQPMRRISPPAQRADRARRQAERSYVDHGLTGTNRARPGLGEVLAACRAGSLHDPNGPPSAPAAEFESDLIKMRTRQGMKVAKAKGRLRANSPNSNPRRKRTSPNCGGRQTRQRRTRRAVLRRPLHRLPRGAAPWRAEGHPDSSSVNSHIFVDETKRRGYLLVTGVVVPSDLDCVRRMLLPGQRRAAR